MFILLLPIRHNDSSDVKSIQSSSGTIITTDSTASSSSDIDEMGDVSLSRSEMKIASIGLQINLI